MSQIASIVFADDTARHNPKDSWWIRDRDGFTKHCADVQFPRMRWSKWGTHAAFIPSHKALSSIELYRLKKKVAAARGGR